ncbi:MAG: helix-turn-helix domain-containing protein [Bacteroidia bacterium]|nr:helix-turn-helix domain-containing protein [Bacteroidia bacterium]
MKSLLNATKKEEEAILRRKDVAAMFQVSLVTINQWAREGRIPYYRINSRIFFKKSEIMQLLTDSTREYRMGNR